MRMSKIFITVLAITHMIEYLFSKCLKAILWLIYFLYRFITFVVLTIYFNVRNLMLWIYYYSVLAIMAIIQIISFPVMFIISLFIIKSYADSKKVSWLEAALDFRENGLRGFVDARKILILSFIISALIYFITYKLFFL